MSQASQPNVPVVGFFSPRSGVGATSLVYHVGHMLADLGVRTVMVDLDPQADLSIACVAASVLVDLWEEPAGETTILALVEALSSGQRPAPAPAFPLTDRLGVIVGDPRLVLLEGLLAPGHSADPEDTPFRAMLHADAEAFAAAMVILDLGPSLGALNRVALQACDSIVVPITNDIFAVHVFRAVAAALGRWRMVPRRMTPVGYVVQEHAPRLAETSGASPVTRLSAEYGRSVLREIETLGHSLASEPSCIGAIKPFHSLQRMAAEARRPMFSLRPADGAVGSHALAVQEAYRDYRALTLEILRRVGVAAAT
jgi:cellulose biosynthesis protein BcsQ